MNQPRMMLNGQDPDALRKARKDQLAARVEELNAEDEFGIFDSVKKALGIGKKDDKKKKEAEKKKKEEEAAAAAGTGAPDKNPDWDEKKHPRGADGRFTENPNAGSKSTELAPPIWPTKEGPNVPGKGIKGEDPFVTTYNGRKVSIESTDGSDLKVSYIDDKLKSTKTVDIPIVKGEKNVWAPELHKIGKEWKIFYTSTGNSDRNEDHRMYVLGGAKTPFGPFTTKTQLGASNPKEDVWGIDMTPVKIGKKQYVTWSGWDGPNDGFPQNLYIAELKQDRNGNLSTGPRKKISSPKGWEGEIMEGPQFLTNNRGETVLTYSGNKSWSTDYSLGAMKLKKGSDPMNPKNWTKKPTPIARNVGHGSWVGKKHIFHTKTSEKEGWEDREIRMTDYKWVDGYPVLDIPNPYETPERSSGRATPLR